MGRQGRGEWGLSRVRGVKNYKKQEGVGPYETHLVLLQVRFLPFQRGWEAGSYLQVLAGRTVNSFDNLEFSQAGTVGEARTMRGLELLAIM